jgi:alkylhydroperoxidase family enzyme
VRQGLTERRLRGNLLSRYENIILAIERSDVTTHTESPPTATSVRLAPLPAERWDDEVDAALAGMLPRWRRNPDKAGNALATMVHHPALTEAFPPYNVRLLCSSTVPARLRELAILRVAHRRNCAYEWAHHVDVGLLAGLTDADIDGVADGTATGFDGTVLAAVDELDGESRISDATWAALGDEFDDRQRMDLIFTVGTYATLAMAFKHLWHTARPRP